MRCDLGVGKDRATGVDTPRETAPRATPWFGIDTVLFFALFYLYFWWVIDPRLIHHTLGVFTRYSNFNFLIGWSFFQEHLTRPGGLVEYAARFCSQLYCFGWAGALIVTAVAWCTCVCMDVLTRLAGGPRGMVLRYAPAVVLLMIYSTYEPPLAIGLALVLVLSCFVLYLKLEPKGVVKPMGVVLLACAVLYYAAGAASLLFPMLVVVYESLVRRRILSAGAAVVSGLGVPWLVGMMFSGLSVQMAYMRFGLRDPGVTLDKWPYALVLYLLFPLALVVAVLWRAVLAWKNTDPPERALGEITLPKREKVFRFLWMYGKWTAQMTFVLLTAGACTWLTLNTRARLVLEIDYHVRHEEWAKALEVAGKIPRDEYNFHCSKNILLSLHHTGRLGDEMFCYPQSRHGGLLTPVHSIPGIHRNHTTWLQQSWFLLDLGQVNLAERNAYEALENTGNLPAILKHLAIIHIVKDQGETAKLFLNSLSRNPFHYREAREMLRRLEEDPRLEGDSRVRELRSVALDKDNAGRPLTGIEDILLPLLARNKHNKMAFEALMAFYLRAARPDKVMANIRRLDDFSYKRIPRHYQEAILVHIGLTGKTTGVPWDKMDRKISRRYEEFCELRRKTVDDKDLVRQCIAAGFGDTFFFYFAHGVSGL